MTVIFLDIDGVLVLSGTKFERSLVGNLNRIIAAFDSTDIRIVFNTAWNIHTLDEMQDFLVDAGFKYPECLHGKTAGTYGGGELARIWLRGHGLVGTPYVLIDDSTRMQSSWGRLAQCRTSEGLSNQVVDKAIDIIRRGILHEAVEKAWAFHNIMCDNQRIIMATPWLSEERRSMYIQRNFEEAKEIMDDQKFMQAACLEV